MPASAVPAALLAQAAVTAAFLIVGVVGCLAASPGSREGLVPGVLCVIGGWRLFGIVSVAVHEAAHALAVLATGGQVGSIELGRPPYFRTVDLGFTHLKLGPDLFSVGRVNQLPSVDQGRLGAIAVFLAGPMADLLLAAVLMVVMVLTAAGAAFGLSLILAGGVLHCVWSAIRNLVPTTPEGLATDGLNLVRILRGHKVDPSVRTQLMAVQAHRLWERNRSGEAQELIQEAWTREPENPYVWGVRLHILGEDRSPREAVECYRRDAGLVPAPKDGGAPWAFVYASIAWYALRCEDQTLMPLTLRFAEAAHAVAPDLNVSQLSLGAVRIAQGAAASGLDLVWTGARTLQAADKPMACRFLAKGERLLGAVERADEVEALGAHLASRLDRRNLARAGRLDDPRVAAATLGR